MSETPPSSTSINNSTTMHPSPVVASARGVALNGDNAGTIITTGEVGTLNMGPQYTWSLPAEVGLEQALAVLAELPTDRVPPATPLPPGSRMPLHANPTFVGRVDEFQTLARVFKATPPSHLPISAITGIGGSGKTQLASEFVHRYGRYFLGGVFWLNFSDPAGIPAEIGLCGGSEHLRLRPDFHLLPFEAQVAEVRRAWASPLPRLLVFDNCEDPSLLEMWRPTTGGCCVLVTSRQGAWDTALGLHVHQVGVLPPADGVALLRRLCPALAADDTTLQAIVQELGALPLALHLAGSYLQRYRQAITPDTYLTKLRAPGLLTHPSLQGQGAGHSPTHHDLNMERTLALSYMRLDAQNPTDALALTLLARAAHLVPGVPIPRPLLLATLADPEAPPSPNAEVDEIVLIEREEALLRLMSFGLLDREAEDGLTLHRLIAAFLQACPEYAGVQEAVEVAVLAEAQRANETRAPHPLLTWQTHLRGLTDRAIPRGDARAVQFCLALTTHLYHLADYQAARFYGEAALSISETALGATHPLLAQSLNNLASLLHILGDLPTSRSYHERALVIREQALGPTHLDTAESLNNLGTLLQVIGEHAASRLHYERALAIYEQVLGPMHLQTTNTLNNLGYLLRAMGELPTALTYLTRALTIREQTLGPHHASTAVSLNSLGLLFEVMGDYPAARAYYERALAIREQILGPTHPATAQSLNNLGILFKIMGDYPTALACYKRALDIREHALGDTHPCTAESANYLGDMLQIVGDLRAARPYYERALAINEHILGPLDPKTQAIREKLAALLAQLEDAAQKSKEHTDTPNEDLLGPPDPKTRAIREKFLTTQAVREKLATLLAKLEESAQESEGRADIEVRYIRD